MPIISVIAAIDSNYAIGRQNNLLCHLPNDLKYFKSVTQGHSVIMGRNTFLSLPNGALPNRRNIVLTRKAYFEAKGCEIAPSLQAAIDLCHDEDEVFVIGGGSVYKEAIKIAHRLYITHIHHRFGEADTFFPAIDERVWKEIKRHENEEDEKNKHRHSFAVYERI